MQFTVASHVTSWYSVLCCLLGQKLGHNILATRRDSHGVLLRLRSRIQRGNQRLGQFHGTAVSLLHSEWHYRHRQEMGCSPYYMWDNYLQAAEDTGVPRRFDVQDVRRAGEASPGSPPPTTVRHHAEVPI